MEIRSTASPLFSNNYVVGGVNIVANQRYHVVGVYSASGNYIRTYVNGVLDRSATISADMLTALGTLRVGGEPYSNANRFV